MLVLTRKKGNQAYIGVNADMSCNQRYKVSSETEPHALHTPYRRITKTEHNSKIHLSH